MSKPPYSMVIMWSEANQAYLVHMPDLNVQKFIAVGGTYAEAATNAHQVIDFLIERYRKKGRPLPDVKREISVDHAG